MLEVQQGKSLVELMRNYTEDYHIAHYRQMTAIEKEFLRKKKLLLII